MDMKELPDVKSPCVLGGKKCSNWRKWCEYCYNLSYFSSAIEKQKSTLRSEKKSNRMGSRFEEENHKKNNKILTAASSLTPNSGAGTVKGDEQITGLVNIMEELKTNVVPKITRGSLTYTIHKEHLEKLSREAQMENKEFWYLKFRFLESQGDTYVVIEEPVLSSMIATIVHDRSYAKRSRDEVDMYRTRNRALETQLVADRAEITALKAEIKFLKNNKDEGEKE